MVTDKSVGTDRVAWFRNARFGMFIHWGLYSITARDMWYYSHEEVPKKKYEKLFDRFNPVDYDPSLWAELARDAGMKYAVITTKHHDGFCLFDSKLTDFKVTNTPYGEDLIKPWVEAFRDAGLKVGFYYSLLDWHHSHFVIDKLHPQRNDEEAKSEKRDWNQYVSYLHGQLHELLTNYGKIDILWSDFSYEEKGVKEWEAEKIVSMAREINPEILINNRLGLPGDFTTPEQYIPENVIGEGGRTGVWESCMTIGQSWGYYRQDPKNKSTAQLIRMLVDTVSKGGNLLLNVGPTPRGRIQDEFVTNLREIGRWMCGNGESICGAGTSQFIPPPDARYTQKRGELYLHLFHHQPGWLALPGLAGRVEYATLLRDGTDLKIEDYTAVHRAGTAPQIKEREKDLCVLMPAHMPDSRDTVVALHLLPGKD